jgi:enoyl-CoA hydratase/carnithine racemase
VVTGGGGDFSAGDDVAMFAELTSAEVADAFVVEVTRLFQLVEAAARPVVAAVDGYALGFGFELALASHLAVATPRARLGLPEITLGAAPPNALGRGPAVIGRGWTRHLALSGRRWLTGEEALGVGLVVELHDPSDLLDAAVALAEEMAAHPRGAPVRRLAAADADTAYRRAPLMMPALLASSAVVANGERFRRG